MSTRGRIGIQLSNGSILSSYHHWDSYESWLGRILVAHYNSYEQASELIDGGDMSCCWTDDRWDDSADGSYGAQYYSQRGEDIPPRLDQDILGYLHPDKCEEYHYLYKNGEWICYNMHQFEDSKQPEIVEIPSEIPLAV